MAAEDLVDDSASRRSSVDSGSDIASKKRKRDDKTYDEIEVDVAAPEPPSKKALRKAKQGKAVNPSPSTDELGLVPNPSDSDQSKATKRSQYGVWIGNLPWNAGKPELTKFILDNANITEADITRIHMPAPSRGKVDISRQKLHAQNKGFAYVDLKTNIACLAVVALSEKLLTGRRLLIKNSTNFEGRPEKTEKSEKAGNAPSKRIFVGNLAFDATEDDLRQHYSKCGEVLSVFMATFEDSGQCKGYAWITFHEVESAEKAVRGWVDIEQEENDSEASDNDDKKPHKSKKPRKWWVNRMKGRSLRTEFAEPPSTRYQKRYGKSRSEVEAPDRSIGAAMLDNAEDSVHPAAQSAEKHRPERTDDRKIASKSRPRIDARSVAPGAALSRAPRQSAAIVQTAGKKITFD